MESQKDGGYLGSLPRPCHATVPDLPPHTSQKGLCCSHRRFVSPALCMRKLAALCNRRCFAAPFSMRQSMMRIQALQMHTGTCGSKARCTMKVRLAAAAPVTPPETGASTMTGCVSLQP